MLNSTLDSVGFDAVLQILSLIGAVILGLFINELHQCLPAISRALIRFYARFLPKGPRGRMEEEWQAMLDSTPGNVVKFVRAFCLIWGLPSLRRTLGELHGEGQHAPRIVSPPGTFLQRFTRFVFPQKVAEQVFEPLIGNIQWEFIEALQDDNKWRSRWVQVRGHITYVRTVFVYVASNVFRKWSD